MSGDYLWNNEEVMTDRHQGVLCRQNQKNGGLTIGFG